MAETCASVEQHLEISWGHGSRHSVKCSPWRPGDICTSPVEPSLRRLDLEVQSAMVSTARWVEQSARGSAAAPRSAGRGGGGDRQRGLPAGPPRAATRVLASWRLIGFCIDIRAPNP